MDRSSGWKRWWWVIAFCFATLSVYFHCIQEKKKQVSNLSTRFSNLQNDLLAALAERDSLRLQIDSQTDPSWIEMVLMRDLGVVPEGWLKVHFTK